MAVNELYVAQVTTLGGRNGHSVSSDHSLDVQQAIPTHMGGPGGAKTNPEQLFAAAWSGCFGTSLAIAASMNQVKLAPEQVKVTASISVLEENGNFSLKGALEIQLPDGIDLATLEKLVEQTKTICSYSKLLHAAGVPKSYSIV